jgi:Xaa-Pro aminopeptidase
MKRTMVVVVAAVMLLAAVPGAQMLPPYGSAAEFRTDLGARRAAAMQALGPESVLILWSAPARVYSTDVDYEYRQESNALYLTGLAQEDSILVLIPGAKTKKEMLFTREGDPRGELWDGHTLTAAEVSAWTGITNVMPLPAFNAFMDSLLSGNGSPHLPADELQNEFGTFVGAVKQGTAKLAVMGGGPALGGRGGAAPAPPAAGSPRAFAEEMHAKYAGVASANATSILNTLRQVKTPYEQKVLRRSVEISAEAHVEGMKAARPGRWEYEVEAAIEYWYLKNGAMSWGYPSIVGSGPNATTLHYGASTRQMQDGDLLLVDAAANFQGLTGDITRTYPINGKFTKAQREIYEIVLAAQEAGLAAAKPGARQQDVTAAVRASCAAGLLKLGLITDVSQIGTWLPHGPIHGIGIDVHDPLGTLVPGSAFVLEPGLYFREDSLANIGRQGGAGRAGGQGAAANPAAAQTPPPDPAAVLAAVRPVFQKYKNIGIRIEDSFLMTETGPVFLSAKAPRQIADIEKIVGTGK